MTVLDVEGDQRIIAAIQQGDKKAFAELYDRHGAWLMAVAYRILNDRNDAEDLLHDVFLEIWKKAASYDAARGTVSSWLAVKVRSRALDRLRALNTVKKHLSDRPDAAADATAPATDASRCVDHDRVKNLLKQLSPVQRKIIQFSYFRGLTCQEIARYCQMPLGTVKSGLLRGVQLLRRKIDCDEVGGPCR